MSEFVTAAIVPEVLAAFNPSVSFYVSYRSADGDAALLHPGAKLTTAEAKAPLELSVDNIGNATNITSTTRYIVYMIGPDVPSRSTPTSRNVRHYLAGNFTISPQNSSLLATASLFTNSTVATNEYAAPAPSAGTISHRYIYLLYTQPPALNSKSFESLGFNASARAGFNLTAFRILAGLGPSIGGTFFETDTEANSTSRGLSTGTSTSPSSTRKVNNTSSAMKLGGGAGSAYELLITAGTAVMGAMLFWDFFELVCSDLCWSIWCSILGSALSGRWASSCAISIRYLSDEPRFLCFSLFDYMFLPSYGCHSTV
ncbi:hypothetical protein VTL71DRAFT_9413 [Oculimacula yallundae]|uniref:PEBP-like protein n=1 Tax=Oculimacula yallundae TaxID=86028 RepID=A0ABR4BU75_9HELO